MNAQYKYILRPYKGPSSRDKCPSCGHGHEFTPYIDQGSGDLLHESVGRCNREGSCGYHYTPKDFFKDNPLQKLKQPGEAFISVLTPKDLTPQKPVQFIPAAIAEATRARYDANHFAAALNRLFGPTIAVDLIDRYKIGTSKHWPGAVAFWQIDKAGNYRQCKVMLYDPATCKRRKDVEAVFLGKKILQDLGANLQQCFFGEHLLSENEQRPVCVVESEKTAVICSVFMPGCLWIATGGSSGCRWSEASVYEVLNGRKIILFPDHGYFTKPKNGKWVTCFEKWTQRAEAIRAVSDIDITVSEVLQNSGLTMEGQDIADYLLATISSNGLALTRNNYPVLWDYPTDLFAGLLLNQITNAA